MRKHLLFFAAAYNTLLLYMYLADDIVPSKFIIGLWGIYMIVSLFLDALRHYYIEKTQVMIKKEFSEKIEPILNNTHLTKEEKQDKIREIFIGNLTQYSKKENNDE